MLRLISCRIFIGIGIGIFLALWGTTGCIAPRTALKPKLYKDLHSQISESAVFQQGRTAFYLYDPERREVLFDELGSQLFTPASNTKILTYYLSSQLLGDSIPALNYLIFGDTLLFYGTGAPGFLHSDLPTANAVLSFFRQQSTRYHLFFATANFQEERYGAGWMWDDYPYYFQVEKAGFPIYGNVIRVKYEDSLQIHPAFFYKKLTAVPVSEEEKRLRLSRDECTNQLFYNGLPADSNFYREIPFRYSDSLFVQLLSDSLEVPVHIWQKEIPALSDRRVVYNTATDSVLQKMMQDSDNFLAEQLLLLCANEVFDTLHTQKIIRYALDHLLTDSPDTLLWNDGSGLSRYNQFTPRSLVFVLEKIYREIPIEKWQRAFPAGGYSGTLRNYFKAASIPFVYAKTGTLRNVRCLSGFVKTRSGRWLIFSFMNNNFPNSSRPHTMEMEKVLNWVHSNL